MARPPARRSPASMARRWWSNTRTARRRSWSRRTRPSSATRSAARAISRRARGSPCSPQPRSRTARSRQAASTSAATASCRNRMKTAAIVAAAGALLLSGMAEAAEIKVLSTQAPQEAYLELVAQFEKATGHKVATVFTGTLNVQKRLAEGEAYDLIIMSGPAIDEQIKLGKAIAGSRVDFARSGTGLAVRKGAAKPDISSADALKKTLLAAKSIGYSTGPSGLYMLSVFER